MQSNLDTLFKTDKTFETDGIWLDISESTGFLVRRFGGYNSPKVKAAMAKHYKPLAKQIDNGSLSQERQEEINAKVFIESCIVDWKGVEIDGKIATYSPEIALKFLLGLPDLLNTLVEYSTSSNNYRAHLGNC